METHVVIMAGGVGSRLWPLSVPQMPKQFIDVLGVGRTLIQLTVERFLPVCPMENFWVVTGERYTDIVRAQLPGIPEDQILSEPEPRNTAPCIAYACWKIGRRHPGANIVVTPADALVLEKEHFARVIGDALAFTRESEAIVTVGIAPTRPDTGYGYICSSDTMRDKVVKVLAFKEKPTLEVAREYLAAGNYFWNAGIFVWNLQTITRELRAHAPGICEVMDALAPSLYTPEEQTALLTLFPRCDKISIDYAVMEKSDHIYVIAGDLGWSDLGGWSSVKEHIGTDTQGNASVGGDIRLPHSRGCIVHAPDAKTVIVSSLEGYIVCVKDGNVLVCPLADEQHIKEYSASR